VNRRNFEEFLKRYTFVCIDRVLSLEKRKEKIIKETKVKSEVMEIDSNSSDEEETLQFDEFLDWRAKKSHK
jgi:hypothetical protein